MSLTGKLYTERCLVDSICALLMEGWWASIQGAWVVHALGGVFEKGKCTQMSTGHLAAEFRTVMRAV